MLNDVKDEYWLNTQHSSAVIDTRGRATNEFKSKVEQITFRASMDQRTVAFVHFSKRGQHCYVACENDPSPLSCRTNHGLATCNLCPRIQEVRQMENNLLARLIHLLLFFVLDIFEPLDPFVWVET